MHLTKIIVVTVVAGIFLVAPMATADPVQEQLRLMEQRMSEMEDRLQATSEELNTAKTTVEAQQVILSEAGLAEDDRGLRSGIGNFLKEVDVTGVVAASYNYRFLDGGPGADDGSVGGNVGFFRHPDSNTIALDQIWLVVDKAVTEESRGGFHAEYVYGKTAGQQSRNGAGLNRVNDEQGILYTGYVSYLAPIGNGVQIDAGLLPTMLGAEVLQTNQNFNITTGLVFNNLQPFTHVGVQASTALTDNIGLSVGVMNDVYSHNNFDTSNDKAYFAQLQFATDKMGLNIGTIVGKDTSLACTDADDDCYVSLLDVVLTADPTDSLSLWMNFDWRRNFGSQQIEGDAFGLAAAGRIALTDTTGFSTRFEYLRTSSSFNSVPQITGATPGPAVNGGALAEIVSLTGTIDHALTDDVKLRVEARWDHMIDQNSGLLFVNGQNGPANGGGLSRRDEQVVALAELYYEF